MNSFTKNTEKQTKSTVHHVYFTEPQSKSKNLPKKSKESPSLFNLLQRTDEAMLNSILSYSVYDSNSWMMENLKSSASDISSIIKNLLIDKTKIYDLKVWNFMKNTFDKIPDHELKIPSEGYHLNDYNYETKFKFKDGQYSAANGLAHACVLKSKHPDHHGDILHLTFRGTEGSRLFEYVKGPYLDMTAYYEHFKPLVEYIREYVNNPNNNIAELQVSGHSLGGAMVQEFLKNNPSNRFEVPIKGFTFGSPGSEKKWYSKFLTMTYHVFCRDVCIPINPNTTPINRDSRITQFYHKNDPIPLFGLLAYNKGGSVYELADVSYNESKEANLEPKGLLEKLPAFGKMISYFKESILNKVNCKFHDSARYIMNLRNNIDSYYLEYSQHSDILKKKTKNYQSWNQNEIELPFLSIKYRKELKTLLKEAEPNLSSEEVYLKIKNILKRTRYDSEAELILLKDNNLIDQFVLLDANSNHLNLEEARKEARLSREGIVSNASLAIDRIKNIKNKHNNMKTIKENVANKI